MSIEEIDDALGIICVAVRVGYHYNGSSFLVELTQQFHYFHAVKSYISWNCHGSSAEKIYFASDMKYGTKLAIDDNPDLLTALRICLLSSHIHTGNNTVCCGVRLDFVDVNVSVGYGVDGKGRDAL